PGNTGAVDGNVDFGNGVSASLLVGLALHELTHAMGRISDGPTTPDIFDLFHFSSQGTILADGNAPGGPSAYFSVDGGTTEIVTYGTSSDTSDFFNGNGLEDPFTEFYDFNTPQTLTALDKQQLDVLGFDTACFAEGTRLATLNGPMPVEALRPGMKVLTVSGAVRPVRWIGHRRIDLSRHPAAEEVCPIRIRAGALEDGVPIRDLRVSPEHAMFLGGGLVPARLLVNGSSIVKETECRLVVWYHVELDSHDLVLAEGAATETYLDTGNRGLFENSGDPLILHPDFNPGQAMRVARSCAPFLDQPAQVEPIWRRLTERAAGLGFETVATLPSTADPDLAIRADGRLFRPVGVARGRHVFVLPPVHGEVRLVSLASPPNALRPWIEDRRGLGIAVSQITVRSARGTRVLTADDPALSDGWFAAEFDADGPRRWTNGDAALPIKSGCPAVVDIRCQPQPAYVLESKRRARIGVAPSVAGLSRARACL
ncbi:MAG TPA: Hint domain-containing protein, partial [Acetobacteraceae bacterium]|nr:Hint domain-containing protein [Acetobacteraceae bacterium]